MNRKELQKLLDDMKYEESKNANKDLCGTYVFCKYCNKKNKYPCASARIKYGKIKGDK